MTVSRPTGERMVAFGRNAGHIEEMTRVFYIVGPTATGKSELAAEVAVKVDGEIVNADAFQIYHGFDVLSGKPDESTPGRVRHHLIGAVTAREEMSAARYRELVSPVLTDILDRGRLPIVVGGTGLYVKVLTDGFSDVPSADAELRRELESLSTDQLRSRLTSRDPAAAKKIDMNNRRRLIRAIEICVTTELPVSSLRTEWESSSGEGSSSESQSRGVFVFRERDDLYNRINRRVEKMLREGAIEEVRNAGELSRTAEQMIGIKDVRHYLAGEISFDQCIGRIQQATRRYAKRQLTWFRRQTNFESLNLSLLSHNEAVEWVSRRAVAGRAGND